MPRPGLSTEDSAGNQACPQEAYILVMEKIQQVVTIQCKEIDCGAVQGAVGGQMRPLAQAWGEGSNVKLSPVV